jgi:multiple sugar transport system substrate-binding protein
MKKGAFCFVMALVLSGSFLFAGGGQSSGDKKTELLVYMPPFGSGDTLDLNFWNKTVAPWAAENNANVSFEIVPWGQLGEKYLAAFSSGAGPDIAYDAMDRIVPFIEMGVAEPLDSYFTQAEKDNYLYWDVGRIRGKQYVLPYVMGNARILYFNMDLLAKAGVTTLPRTWDEFVAFGQKINAANLGSDIMTFVQPWLSSNHGASALTLGWLASLWEAGGDMFDASGADVALLQNDGALRTAQFYYDLMNKYNITSKESFSFSIDDARRMFWEGKAVCAMGVTADVSQLRNVPFKWDFVDSLQDKTKAIWIAADFLFMNSACKDKAKAASLMKFMSSPRVKEAFHRELNTYIPISKDEAYLDFPEFKDMYANSKFLRANPATRNWEQVSNNLYGNLQLMMLGQISPQEAIKRTVDYSKTLQ